MNEQAIKLLTPVKTTRINTNFGFIILYDNGETANQETQCTMTVDIDVYGMSGLGRYEFLGTCTCSADLERLAFNLTDALEDIDIDLDKILDVYAYTKAKLEGDPWESPWVLDNRSRCVAVYRGPKQECLGSIHNDPKCVFFRSWSEHTENEQPDVPEKIRGEAQRVYNALVKK